MASKRLNTLVIISAIALVLVGASVVFHVSWTERRADDITQAEYR